MSAQDLIASAVAGASVAFVGSVAISFFRSFKLLDDDRAVEISAQDAILRQFQEPQNTHHEHLQQQVKTALDVLSDEECKFVAWLLDAGACTSGQVIQAGFNYYLRDNIVRKTVPIRLLDTGPIGIAGLLIPEGTPFCRINPNMESALRNALHPVRPVTPPQA